MELKCNLLNEQNEKILSRLDETIGLSKTKDKIREIIRFYEMMQKCKSKFENENYNIVIRNNSAYILYEELIDVIAELYYKNKITKFPNAMNIEKDQLKKVILKEEDCKVIEDSNVGIIVLNFLYVRERVEEIRKISKMYIDRFPDKSIVILEDEFVEGKVNAAVLDFVSWGINIEAISDEEKEEYIESFFKENNLNCDIEIIADIANNPYYKIKSILLNILANCKLNKTNNVNEVINININNNETKKETENKKGRIELDNLIGLNLVKEQLIKVINYIKVSKNKENMPMLHMCFNGNPGTGKTTVARIVGKIFAEEKILSDKNIFVEAQRENLIGEYVGHTAPKTKRVINRSLGGVLFIDEAYTLTSYIQDEKGNDFGAECIATLIKEMEDKRDNLCVILAGYTNEMNSMLKANPGFESRIQFIIDFPDYSKEELYEIFKNLCKKEKYKISSNVKQVLINHFNIARNSENFSNARYVRSLFEKIKIEQANRVINENKDINTICKTDVENVLKSLRTQEKNEKTKIGFVA